MTLKLLMVTFLKKPKLVYMNGRYREQDLRNQSFKGQDLRGKDFSDAKLGGSDFSDAKLGGADFSRAELAGVKFCRAELVGTKFCRAKMGQTGKIKLLSCLSQSAIGSGAGLFGVFSLFLLTTIIVPIQKWADLPGNFYITLFTVGYTLIFGCILLFSISRQRLDYLFWYFLGPLIVGTLIAVGRSISQQGTANLIDRIYLFDIVPIVNVLAGILILAVVVVAGGKTTAVAAAVAAFVAAADPPAIARTFGLRADEPNLSSVLSASASVLVLISFCIYLGNRATRKEERQFSLLHTLRLKLHCIGGTRFDEAKVIEADFSGVDFNHACIHSAKFTRCIWTGARNLNLAQTFGTLLAPRAVRTLLAAGACAERDLSDMNLAGVNFSGIKLAGFNFSNTNLSDADFSGCDLTDANFFAANATGTKFNGATFTGANIYNWHIDAHTELRKIECTFIRNINITDQDEHRQRNQPVLTFQPGEFSKQYQQVAGAVLNVKTPPELDRNQVSLEIKQEFAVKLAVSAGKVETLCQERDYLRGIVTETQRRKITIINNLEASMGNRNQNLQGAVISQAVVNLGDYATLSSHISHLPESKAELGAILSELQALIAASTATKMTQADALRQTQTIVEVAQQEGDPELGLVRRALKNIKEMFEINEDVSGIGQEISDVIVKLALYFHIS